MLNLVCWDEYGNNIDHLTQWDVNQELIIEVSDFNFTVSPKVHFCNVKCKEALVVMSNLADNGMIRVKVPNILLQEPYQIIVYLYVYSSDTSAKTLADIVIPVRKRPKPSEYEYVQNIDSVTADLIREEIRIKLQNLDKQYNDDIEDLNTKYDETIKNLDKKYNDMLGELLKSMKDGSPKGIFTTQNDLASKEAGIYINTTDGYIYYWDGKSLSAPISQYQSTGIAVGSITYEMFADALKQMAVEDNRIFGTFADAEAYLETDACTGGQFVKVLEDGEYAVYIVQPSSETASGWSLEEASLGGSAIALEITSFTNNVNYAELGSTVSQVKFTWSMNQIPYSLTLEGNVVDTSTTTITLTVSLKANKTYTLTASLKKGTPVTKNTSIQFCNGLYYGVGVSKETYDNAFILSLSKQLKPSKSTSFSVTSGANEYVYFAMPTRYGSPLFNIGGFDYEYDKVATFNFTNASGYAESYDVYKSGQHSLGKLSITVK